LIAFVLLIVVLVGLTGCSRNPLQPVPADPIVSAVDFLPIWSRDGESIAFVRRVPSSYGPLGVYVVSRHGGTPRYVAPADVFWPRHMSFSPDGRQIVASYGLQLYVIDVASATGWNLFYTANGANYPDWSPDGRYILYSRVFSNLYEPRDSAGLHSTCSWSRTSASSRPGARRRSGSAPGRHLGIARRPGRSRAARTRPPRLRSAPAA
jgi:Tol biopolymer transport system component